MPAPAPPPPDAAATPTKFEEWWDSSPWHCGESQKRTAHSAWHGRQPEVDALSARAEAAEARAAAAEAREGKLREALEAIAKIPAPPACGWLIAIDAPRLAIQVLCDAPAPRGGEATAREDKP